MNINIRPNDVSEFARRLTQWSREIENTSRSIGNASRSLENKWKDSNYKIFILTITAKQKELNSTVQQFKDLSNEMKKMARELEDAQRKNSQRLR